MEAERSGLRSRKASAPTHPSPALPSQAEAERAEAEVSARFQANTDRAAREKEAGMDSEPPDNSRHLRNQARRRRRPGRGGEAWNSGPVAGQGRLGSRRPPHASEQRRPGRQGGPTHRPATAAAAAAARAAAVQLWAAGRPDVQLPAARPGDDDGAPTDGGGVGCGATGGTPQRRRSAACWRAALLALGGPALVAAGWRGMPATQSKSWQSRGHAGV
jgi:hypothetical protein